MAEEKPFEATPNKIRKARREGNVARSQELTTVVVFAASGAATFGILPWLGLIMRQWIVGAPFAPPQPALALHHAALVLSFTLIPLVAAAVAGTAVNLVQTGGPVFVSPKFKPEYLKPDEGFKRMFSPESAVSIGRAILAFAATGAAFAPTIGEIFTRAVPATSSAQLVNLVLDGAAHIGGTAIAVASAFAVVDVILARNRWRKKLRMDAYEIKRDMKESEGNPQLKSRRRAIHRSLQRGAARNVKKAAFVVTNPTHIAVALAYDPPTIAVPRILVVAADHVAQNVKSLAHRYGIVVIEDVALARLLYATGTVGAAIPREAFVAVAELVAHLQRSPRSA